MGMEQFLRDVRAYAELVGLKPSTVIQKAKAGSGSTWERWEERKGSPTLKTVDRVRRYMAANPPPKKSEEDAA